jgi:hypothetical protein
MFVCFTFVSSITGMIYSKQLVLLCFHIWPSFKIIVLSSFNSVQVAMTFNLISKQQHSSLCKSINGASTLNQNRSLILSECNSVQASMTLNQVLKHWYLSSF